MQNGRKLENLKSGKSVNERKKHALNSARTFDVMLPDYSLAQIMGVSRNTLTTWKKGDPQFSDELENILLEKRADLVEKANRGLERCIEADHYPAIRDTLRTQDPDNWSEPEESTTHTVNIMYLNLPRPEGNGKLKKITTGRHRLK